MSQSLLCKSLPPYHYLLHNNIIVTVKYRISSIKRPGVYLLPEFADPALIQDRRLYGTGVYKHNDVIKAAYIVGTGRHK